MTRSNVGTVCMALGLLCLLSSGGLLFYNRVVDNQAGEAAQSALCEVQAAVSDTQQEMSAVPDRMLQEDELSVMTVIEVGGYGYIGYLSLPKIEIELPVMDDWDYSRLKIAPCRQFGTVESKNLVIAAHNYERHFGKLNLLEYGDLISFTDMTGKMTVYAVSDIEVLQPTQVDEVKDSIWDLTLYTCTYGGQSRVVVRCTEVDPELLKN